MVRKRVFVCAAHFTSVVSGAEGDAATDEIGLTVWLTAVRWGRRLGEFVVDEVLVFDMGASF